MPRYGRRLIVFTSSAIIVFGQIGPGFAQSKTSAARPAATAPASAQTPAPWPRVVSGDGFEITIYQPQIDKWSGDLLEARAAVSVSRQSTPEPALGVIWITARTQVDRANGLVALDDIKITKANFPTDAANTETYLSEVRDDAPTGVRTISLARLQASLAVADDEQEAAKAVPVKNDPPRIIYNEGPSMLVLVDGKPDLREVAGTKLLRVINTRAMIVLDQPTGTYYLRALKGWRSAPSLDGPWKPAAAPPAALATALKAAGNQVDPMDTPAPEITEAVKAGATPTIYVSQLPAELVQTEGKPEFAPIPGTQLLYVNNTDSQLVIDVGSQDYYVLIAGRWFRTKSLANGPWEYVANDRLPADFAKIPENHPKADVLASVSGTPQAQAALIDNQIPQTASVDRTKAKVNVRYDGAPKLQPIEGTPLEYVVNSPVPVIKVAADSYYAVENGVWFVGSTVNGPWVVATEVPPVIYTIPASSPLHYVTYVRVYGASGDIVYVGYTPGYYGTVVSPTGTVVYGTGYYYPSYVGSYWYPYPATYGYGSAFAWGAVAGFTLGAIAGAAWYGGAWGWNRWRGDVDININRNIDFNRNNVYNRWNNNVVNSRVDNRIDRDFNNRGDRQDRRLDGRDNLADRANDARNRPGDNRPGNNRPGYNRPGDNRPGADNRPSAGRDKAGDRAGNRPATADRAKPGGGKQGAGSRPAARPANVANDRYAGRDGNVYKRGPQGWEGAQGGPSAGEIQRLNRSEGARISGGQIERSRASYGGGGRGGYGGGYGGGGNFRGGGGGGPRFQGGGGGFRGGGGGGRRR